MLLDLDRVECASLFDLARWPSYRLTASQLLKHGGGALQITEARDVLFLPNALEAGQSLCLIDERIVPKEAILDCWNVDFFKQMRRDVAELRNHYSEPFSACELEGPACILGNLLSRNFGHWTEELLKVAVLEELQTDCLYLMPSSLPPFAREFLELLGIPAHRIAVVDRPTRVSRAIFTTAVNHENVPTFPAPLFALRELVESRLGTGGSPYGPRVWLDRRRGVKNGGFVTNPDEVYRRLEPYGFAIVDMAAVSVADQLRTARHARVLAGMHGSQFVHAQFMPLSSTVVECFSPTHVNPSILQICRVLGHRYYQVVSRTHVIAPYKHGVDCKVDCDHLSVVLESVLR